MIEQIRESVMGPGFWGRFQYSRAELIADGIVHAVGIVLAIAAGSVLLSLSVFHAGPGEYVAAIFYVVSLLTVLSISLAYNLWPMTPAKWILRRCDHAAIYLLIAGTYTAFLLPLHRSGPLLLLLAIWSAAAVGVVLKLKYPGRFDRVSIALYLFLGWSGLLVFHQLAASFSEETISLIMLGGVLYSVGVIFHVWSQLRYQNAIWHGFVLVAAVCHYGAVASSFGLT